MNDFKAFNVIVNRKFDYEDQVQIRDTIVRPTEYLGQIGIIKDIQFDKADGFLIYYIEFNNSSLQDCWFFEYSLDNIKDTPLFHITQHKGDK